MKNILITGGAGFIGSNFIHYLFKHEAGIKVINLDALTYAGRLANLKEVQIINRQPEELKTDAVLIL